MNVGTAARPRRARSRVRRYIPPQHGAWAMLIVPWVAGVITAGFGWIQLPLLGAWIAGYLASYYALLAVKTCRVARVRDQLVAHGGASLLLSGIVLVANPRLLWFAPAYGLLLAVNVTYARLRDERALLNDLASVAQSGIMVLVAATAVDAPLRPSVPAFLAVVAYFTATVLYVKTMIRERGNVAYYRASVTFHSGALILAAFLTVTAPGPAISSAALVVVFALLLARAALLPRHALSPKTVGLLEIAASASLLATLLAAPLA